MQMYFSYFKCPVTKQMRYPVNAYKISVSSNRDRNRQDHQCDRTCNPKRRGNCNDHSRKTQAGRQEGRQEGIKEGSYNTYFNLIQNMKKKNLSDKEIAGLINIDIDLVKKIINKEQVEIPLHLLDQDF